MKKLLRYTLIISAIFLSYCGRKDSTSALKYHKFSEKNQKSIGRIKALPDGSIELIGAASYIEFHSLADSLKIPVINRLATVNYISVFIGKKVVDRYAINPKDTTILKFKLLDKNNVKIVKDTEAANGSVVIPGVWSESIVRAENTKSLLIEFIGNSITCGMGADTEDIPCGENEWFDQHRASFAYGPLVADSINSEFVLSSVSGIGIYRNWNDENIEEPNMPQVYDNLYLNLDSTYRYEPTEAPDLISICLGTNDLSTGDGIKERLPFNQQKYVDGYITFVGHLIKRYPTSKIVLLTSPMVGGEKGIILKESLMSVAGAFKESKEIEVFEFEPMVPTGCTYHPSLEEHQIMANQLIPFYRALLND